MIALCLNAASNSFLSMFLTKKERAVIRQQRLLCTYKVESGSHDQLGIDKDKENIAFS